MNDIQIFDYNGNGVSFRNGNSVMVSATEMAKPFNKQAKDWLKTQSTKEFILTLSEVKKILPSDLVQVINGDNGGTWMHEYARRIRFKRILKTTTAHRIAPLGGLL